ncbi:cytochrome P450 [Fennellomyces sp. T-0311]|nr:cytochrome P450 [Fennellomyces sp. T-0311]
MPELISTSSFGVAILACVAALGLLGIKYNNRAVFTRARDDIPKVPGVPLFGNLFAMLANTERMLDFDTEEFDKLDTMTMYLSSLGLPPQITTMDPNNIEHVLKTNFSNYVKGSNFLKWTGDLFGHGIFAANGEQWRYQRKSASLIFNVLNFRDHFTEVFVNELGAMSRFILDEKVTTGEPIDFYDAVYKFTLQSFVIIGFGKNLQILESKDANIPFAESFDICQWNCAQRFFDPFNDLRRKIQSILHPSQPTIEDHIKIIDDFVYTLINSRKEQLAQGYKYKDLLSRFMTTRNEEGQIVSNKELRDMVLNFILAGRDSTAQTLSWTLHYLFQHPQVEAKLVAEVNEYIPDGIESDPPTLYEAIKKMNYAHAIFFEVLRLEPVVPINQKMALEDDVLPDGTMVYKGDVIVWVPYAMGRATKIWGTDAKEFKPERWFTPEGELRRETASKWPAFHVGPRICLGQHLATLETLVALSLLLKRYKFSRAPGPKVEYEVSLTHPMKNGLQVFVEKRN